MKATSLLVRALMSGGVLLCAAPAFAQAPVPAAQPPLVNQRPELAAPRTLKVTSPDFTDGGAIPFVDSGYGASRSPALAIDGAPAAAKSFTILIEDANAQKDGAPILHWMVFDVPAGTTRIPAAIPAGAMLSQPVSLMQGPNVSGQAAYRGPHPPQTSANPHHYHVEVFALDTVLPDGAGADRATLAAAMQGHVLAQGELVGTFSAPAAEKPAG